MRKKIFAAMIVAVIAMFAGYNMYQSQRAESTMSDLALANVEALAGNEGGLNDCATYCEKDERYTCIIMYVGSDGITCPDQKKKGY